MATQLAVTKAQPLVVSVAAATGQVRLRASMARTSAATTRAHVARGSIASRRGSKSPKDRTWSPSRRARVPSTTTDVCAFG